MDTLGAGVSSVLVTKLSHLDALQVVERSRLEAVLTEQHLQQSGVVDPASAVAVGKVLGADYMVFGSLISAQLPAIAVSVRVVDVQTGQVVVGEDVHGEVGETGQEFFVLLDELAFALLDGLELRLAARDRIELSQVQVRELQTVSVYGSALEAMDRGQQREAEGYLMDALSREPGFGLAQETLDRLRAEVSRRQSDYAHEAVERARRAAAQLSAALSQEALPEAPSFQALADQALLARLELLDGHLAEAMAREERRAAWTVAHYEALHALSDYPEGAFQAAVRDRLQGLGIQDPRGWFRDPPFWPWEVRAQQAELLVRTGHLDQGVALLLDTYQRPGPVSGPRSGPDWPRDTLQRWGAWDTAVVLKEQRLRQAELTGREEQIHRVVDQLDATLSSAARSREELQAWGALRAKLREGPITPALGREEQRALRTLANHPELVVAGYQEFQRRAEAGAYRELREADPRLWRDLVEGWSERAAGLWRERWFVQQRLAVVLAKQAQLPAGDPEEAARQREALESFIRGEYGS